MKSIDTRVCTYEPECIPSGELEDRTPSYAACMFPATDGTGHWVYIAEHERVVDALQRRITYLENICEEQTRMLTGD